MKGIAARIWSSEWFSTTNTSSFVTVAGCTVAKVTGADGSPAVQALSTVIAVTTSSPSTLFDTRPSTVRIGLPGSVPPGGRDQLRG